MVKVQRKWWKDATVYQIWPSSYKDSNGDGIGDIQGIISTLDYLKELGTDVIWLSPSYKSPQKDMGYDISDYEDIDPRYGTLQDADQLIGEVHARGMKIIFDLVINHTSDQHAWFRESRSSKDNPKRDWYIWRPARYDEQGNRRPPNNWRTFLGTGSAWEWDEATQEYYLHLFVPEQPDLNWEREETRRAIYASAVTFWLDRGVDGFRIDTVNMYSKPTEFVDGPVSNPRSEFQLCPGAFCNGPRMHEFLGELHAAMEPYDTMTVGELGHTAVDKVRDYVSAARKQMDMVFQFDVVELGKDPHSQFSPQPFALSAFKRAVAAVQRLSADRRSDTWSTAHLENHDEARSLSRFATDAPRWRARAAKLLATMLATLSGTLFLYQGQELGMANFPRSWGTDEYKDVEPIEVFKTARRLHAGDDDDAAAAAAAIDRLLDGAQKLARDHARTPVQWTAGPNAGFCDAGVEPWMRVNDDYKEWNAASQVEDPDSVLSYWKEALRVRKANREATVYGGFEVLQIGGEDVFAYVKDGEEDGKLLVVLNFTSERKELKGFGSIGLLGEVLLANVPEAQRENASEDAVALLPWEARVYKISGQLAN